MSRNQKIILAGAIGAGLCLLCSLIAIAIPFFATADTTDVGHKLMAGLRDEDYEAVWDTLHPDLQAELGSYTQLVLAVATINQPAEWTISEQDTNSGETVLRGRVTFDDGSQGLLVIVLEQAGDEWLVTSFTIRPDQF